MKTITGTWNYPDGSAVANGVLYLKLSQDAVASSTAQIAPRVVAITLNASGQIPANTQIWANDELTPTGTFYKCSVVAPGGSLVWGEEDFSITGASPINMNSLVPVLSAGSPVYSQLQQLTLQTNGVNNGSQNKLNLVAGTAITLTDNGSGSVTIASSGGGVSGAISITNTPNTGGTGSTPINVSTEGTKDWLGFSSAVQIPSMQTFSSGVHAKILGGWIVRSFYGWGPMGTIANYSTASTPWVWSSTLGDDATQGTFTDGNNIISSINVATGFFANGASVISGGFGF